MKTFVCRTVTCLEYWNKKESSEVTPLCTECDEPMDVWPESTTGSRGLMTRSRSGGGSLPKPGRFLEMTDFRIEDDLVQIEGSSSESEDLSLDDLLTPSKDSGREEQAKGPPRIVIGSRARVGVPQRGWQRAVVPQRPQPNPSELPLQNVQEGRLYKRMLEDVKNLPLPQQVARVVEWWAKCIDQYDVVLQPNTFRLLTQRVKLYGEPITVETLFGAENVRVHLHKDAVDTKVKRQAFFQKFVAALPRVPVANGQNALITVEELVGPGNLKAYKDALKEERDSPAYRNRVVMLGVENYQLESNDQQWALPKHFVVGGSSGAGKTFGTRTILRLLMRTARKDERLEKAFFGHGPRGLRMAKVKYIVSVDGGDARSASQVRKMILQCALVLGYKGIKDLHKQSSVLEIKDHIKNAAFADGSNVHVVEPRTFSDFTVETYDKITIDAAKTVYCIVNTPAEVIRVQGERRAWYNLAKKPPPSVSYIQINNPDPGCESKAYSDGGLEWGARKSEQAVTEYIRECEKRGHTPVVVVLNNQASVANGNITYTRPNLGVYYGPLKTKFSTVTKIVIVARADRVVWPDLDERQRLAMSSEKNNLFLRLAMDPSGDTTILTQDSERGFIYATSFDKDFWQDV